MEVCGTQHGSVRLAGNPWDRDFRHERVNIDVAILIRIVVIYFHRFCSLVLLGVRCTMQGDD